MTSSQNSVQRNQIIFLVILMVVGVAALAYALNILIIPELGDDTRHRYVACEAFYEGLDPYSAEVDARIDSFTGDGQSFWYPAHICVVMAPMWFLPYQAAVSLWRAVNFIFLLALPAIYMTGFFRHTLPVWKMLLLTIVTFIGFRYIGLTIIIAQYTGFVLACMVAGLWFLSRRQQLPAAICFSLMSIRPDGVVLSLGLMFVGWYTKQRRIPLYWAGLMLAYWAVTSLFEPLWVINFINQVRNYRSIGGHFLPLLFGPVFGVAFALVVLVVFGYLFRRALRAYPDGPMRIITLSTVVITALLLVIPHTNPYTLIYALPTYMFILYIADTRPLLWWVTLLSMPFWSHGLNFTEIWNDQLIVPPTVALLFIYTISLLPTEEVQTDSTTGTLTEAI